MSNVTIIDNRLSQAIDALAAVLSDLPESPARSHAEAHLRTASMWAQRATSQDGYIDRLHAMMAGREQTIANHERQIEAHEATISDLQARLAESEATPA